MKANLNVPFMGINGKPVVDGEKREVMISSQLIVHLYGLAELGGRRLGAEEKLNAYRLFQRLQEAKEQGKELEYSHQDALLLEQVAAEHLSVGGYGQVYDLLERNEK